MAKLTVYIAFIIYCQAANQNQAQDRGKRDIQLMQTGVAAEVITDYKADKLWEDGRLIVAPKVEECMFHSLASSCWEKINLHNYFYTMIAAVLMNCGTMEDGRLSILEDKSFLFVGNSFDLIK
uniref:Secreted protein n=1 Tax=Loa loa TaxID=7209 RepID=A0A1I7VB36_LOALO